MIASTHQKNICSEILFMASLCTKIVFFHLQLMSAIVNRDWTQLVRVCCLDNWREVLAALVTYAGPDEFSSLCGELIIEIFSIFQDLS